MGKSHINAVVFDLGNVLVDFDHMVAARKIFGLTKKTPQEIFDLFFDSELVALFEEGKIAPPQFFAKTKKMLGLDLDYDNFLPVWNEIFSFTENNRQVYDLAKSLNKRYKVALLTNINALHFDYLKKKFPIFDAFPNIITSFETGARKPAPLIYEKALDLLGAAPQDTFYTDDRIDLIEKACSLGIRGFVFKGVEQLKRNLLDNAVTLS